MASMTVPPLLMVKTPRMQPTPPPPAVPAIVVDSAYFRTVAGGLVLGESFSDLDGTAGHKTAMDAAASGLSKSERATLIGLLKKLGVSAAAQVESRTSKEA